MQTKALTDRCGAALRRVLPIGALVLAGPAFIELLLAFFSSLRHPSGGTCAFNDSLLWARAGYGLLVYWAGPWIILGAIVLAVFAKLRGQVLAVSLRILAAPGFGLACAVSPYLILPAILALRAFEFQYFLSPFLSGAAYAPLILPCMAFVMTFGSRWQSAFNDPKWFGVAASLTLASYLATWTLVRPFVLDSFSCSLHV